MNSNLSHNKGECKSYSPPLPSPQPMLCTCKVKSDRVFLNIAWRGRGSVKGGGMQRGLNKYRFYVIYCFNILKML